MLKHLTAAKIKLYLCLCLALITIVETFPQVKLVTSTHFTFWHYGSILYLPPLIPETIQKINIYVTQFIDFFSTDFFCVWVGLTERFSSLTFHKLLSGVRNIPNER